MSHIIKETLLQYVPNSFVKEIEINPYRIFKLKDSVLKKGYVVYLCEREIRFKDNFALQFALAKSLELNLPLKILLSNFYFQYQPKNDFLYKQLKFMLNGLRKFGFEFEFIDNSEILQYLLNLPTSILILDFNPIKDRTYLKSNSFIIYEVDGHNIIPARFVSDKQEYSAATLRRKIYHNIYPFLTEFNNLIDDRVEADNVLHDFIDRKLANYVELKNNPEKNVISGLSKYLNWGFISSQRVALEVIKSNVEIHNKEAFLEELVIRKELADNFCLYCKDFKSLSCIPNWAKLTLLEHRNDIRTYDYSLEEFENAATHDELWNSTQIQLKTMGVIHSYLRMYWAKKILEWTSTPEKALEIAISLNDKYAYDAPSASGYVGILWSIGALHDRPFQDWFITGKIRRMSAKSIERKFNISDYIKHFSPS